MDTLPPLSVHTGLVSRHQVPTLLPRIHTNCRAVLFRSHAGTEEETTEEPVISLAPQEEMDREYARLSALADKFATTADADAEDEPNGSAGGAYEDSIQSTQVHNVHSDREAASMTPTQYGNLDDDAAFGPIQPWQPATVT